MYLNLFESSFLIISRFSFANRRDIRDTRVTLNSVSKHLERLQEQDTCDDDDDSVSRAKAQDGGKFFFTTRKTTRPREYSGHYRCFSTHLQTGVCIVDNLVRFHVDHPFICSYRECVQRPLTHDFGLALL